jgi:predicted neuraminidase
MGNNEIAPERASRVECRWWPGVSNRSICPPPGANSIFASKPMSLVGSTDNSETWSRLLDLETGEGEFSYPAIIAAGGSLHVTYTWNRKNIVYYRLRPA